MQEANNILRILKTAKTALQKEDSFSLRNLSNQTNNTASRTQDPDNIAIAVIIYSLSKIIERAEYKKTKGWEKLYNQIILGIDNLILDVKKENEKEFKRNIENLRKSIEKLSVNLKGNIQEVFRKASINKASKIYEHGISMEKTAKLLGITLWELAGYAGAKSSEGYKELKTINTKDRIKTAMEIFG